MSNRLPLEQYRILCLGVMERDKWKCRVCTRREGLHAHHVVFRSQGGEDTSSNLVTICFLCHEKVHSRQYFLFGDANFVLVLTDKTRGVTYNI